MIQQRELSGVCHDDFRWQECWKQLASADCSISMLRIYHNSSQQCIATAQTLTHNSSVKTLEVGVSESHDAAQALAEVIQGSNSNIQTLAIQDLHGTEAPPPATAAAAGAAPAHGHVCPLLHALAANSSIICLTLRKLQPGQIQQLAAALETGGCASSLQELRLPGARLDAAAAAALSAALANQPQLRHLDLKDAVLNCHKQLQPGQHQCQQDQEEQEHQCQQIQEQQEQRQHAGRADGVQGCAVGQLFSPALAGHPSLCHVRLQSVTCSTGSSVGGCSLCWHSLGAYVAAAQLLQELVLAEAGLCDAEMQQFGLGLAAAAAAPAGAAAAPDASRAHAQALGSSSSNQTSTTGSTAGSAGLRALDLCGNAMAADGARALGWGLATSCRQLAVLQLGGMKLGPAGVSGLVGGLLEAADAAGTDAAGTDAAGVAAAVVRAGQVTCAGPCQSKELDLSGNSICDADGLQRLLSHPIGWDLLTLNLSNNCLDDQAVQLLVAVLGSSGSTVSSSTISSSTSVQDFDRPTPSCDSRHICNFTHLELSHNLIKDKGAAALAALLRQQAPAAGGTAASLLALLLHYNRMSRAGVEALVDAAIVGNRRVLELQLQGNRVLGKLPALEDLRLVLADRRGKLQPAEQQQQQVQVQEGRASVPGSGSPREQQQQQQHTAGGCPGSTHSPLLSPRFSGSAAAMQSPFASANLSALAAAAGAEAANRTNQTEANPSKAGPAACGPASADTYVHAVDAAAHILVTSSASSSGLVSSSSKPAFSRAAAAAPNLHKASAPAAPGAAPTAPGAAAAVPAGLSFQLPSLAGRFRQQQQHLRLGERSFSFDQWCADNALQLAAWSSLGGSIGDNLGPAGSSSEGGTDAAGNQPKRLRKESRFGAQPMTAAGGGQLDECEDSPGEEQQDGPESVSVAGGEGPCLLLLEDDSPAHNNSAGTAEGRYGRSDSSSGSSNGQLLGQAVCLYGGQDEPAVAAAGAAAAVGVEDVGRVSSLAGWMSDQVFMQQAGRELLLPGVRRRYQFVHGPCDSSSGSNAGISESGTVVAGNPSQAVTLAPFRGGADGGPHVGRAAVARHGGGRLVATRAASAGSGLLVRWPKASAASLWSGSSSDGSAGGSRSSSIDGGGGGSGGWAVQCADGGQRRDEALAPSRLSVVSTGRV